METALVGYTGFVGSNLLESYKFDGLYNSRNIGDSYGTRPELLVYAGVRAEKFLANSCPEEDFRMIREAAKNIIKIEPKRLVLISTIDVYDFPSGADEQMKPNPCNLQPYGTHRLWLENKVRELLPETLIIRLPALFGKNIKKNFIYDILHPVPSLLSAKKMEELSNQIPELNHFYKRQENGFYRYNPVGRENAAEEEAELLRRLQHCGFTSLKFTDSRNCYQFYHLQYLWKDIQKAMQQGILLLNLATEPINAGELYFELTGERLQNHLPSPSLSYNFKSIHAKAMGGHDGYLYSAVQMKEEIRRFIEGERMGK